jgi:NADH:ubiquinone oxidoreductase subunit 2 (subunit N)
VVLASAISAYFYLRVVAVMYFNSNEGKLRTVSTPLLNVGIGAMVVANVVLGLFSQRLIDLADHWADALTVATQASNTLVK